MKKTNNNLTEMVFILDRSGSMYGLEKDTIGGFNSMLAKQKNEEGEAFVTTVLFDNEYEIIHDRLRVRDVHEMSDNEYKPRGSTALIDAIGRTIKHIANIHKYQRKESNRPVNYGHACGFFTDYSAAGKNKKRRKNKKKCRKSILHNCPPSKNHTFFLHFFGENNKYYTFFAG